MVSTHSHPKVAAAQVNTKDSKGIVSTHSHPKVAAELSSTCSTVTPCFNTQPPEGGCEKIRELVNYTDKFQHTATRRWLPEYY